MKAYELFNHLGIPYIEEGNKHCSNGWVNTHCPFCAGSQNYHLGFNIEQEFFRCWRCGWHPLLESFHKLSGQSYSDIKDALRLFGGRVRQKKNSKEIVRMKAFQLPSGTVSPLLQRHRSYLEKRNFDPDMLEKVWGIRSTEITSKLDGSDYGNRILIPIYWDGKIISFQCRAVSNKDPKYKTCSKDRELLHHKHILYGKQDEWQDTGICVEGVTDVWRFGPLSFAVFGIEYKLQQVQIMCKYFKRVLVCFDDDPQAIRKANKLVSELKSRGVSAKRIPIIGDPGSMDQDAADKLIQQNIKEFTKCKF